jgi:hypothetical protein
MSSVPETIKLEDLLVEQKPLPRYDPERLRLELEINSQVEIVGKPSSYRLKGNEILLRFFDIEVSGHLRQLGNTPDEILMRLRTNNIWRVGRRQSGAYVLASVRSIVPTEEEFRLANKLLELYNPLELIVRGMGYEATSDVYKLMIPRIMALAVDELPFHVVQLTPPESGKTYFGIWAMKYAGWFYTTSPPTPAGMFYDARSGVYGFAIISNGVIFDEVDKWNPMYVQQTSILTYLPTFLENGVVVRPTSRLHTLGVVERMVNTVWFGNYGVGYEFEKDPVQRIFVSWGDNYGALIDRVTIVHVEDKPIRISQHLTNRVLPEALMYAVLINVKGARADVNMFTSRLKGRQRRHSTAIQVAGFKLGAEVPPDMADEIVQYGWASTWERYKGMDING